MQEEEEEGGWAPFMPNITILIALMLFLVWRGGGVGRETRDRKPSQHCTAMFLITTHYTLISLLLLPLHMYEPAAPSPPLLNYTSTLVPIEILFNDELC